MKHCLAFCIVFLALSTLGLTCIDDSWAARMGGGRSFGSQPTMRTPTVAPRPMQSPRQQPYTNPSAAAPARTGGMGAMGGLFGGLLAGTVLGYCLAAVLLPELPVVALVLSMSSFLVCSSGSV